MKLIKIMVMLGLFLGMTVGDLFAQYLDVGDDPEKIQIVSKKKIMYNGNPVGGYAWSHDGEWFMGANNDGGYIMDKNGAFLQKLPRKFNYYQVTIFYDNRRIFYDFEENKKTYYAIYNLQTKQETILAIDPQQEGFIDISLQGDILFVRTIVEAHKISGSFISINPESSSRLELGVIGLDISNKFGDNSYVNKKNLLLRILDNEFKIKKYNFDEKKLTEIIADSTSEPTYYQLHDGRHIIANTDNDTVSLYEISGILIGKFKAFFDRGGPDQLGNNPNLIPGYNDSDRAVAPNGKLILIRMDEYGNQSGNASEEIYLFNLKGKSVRFMMPYSMFSFKWSPQGDRMLNGDLIVFLKKSN